MHVVMRDKIKTHTRFSFRPKAETTSLEMKSKAEGVPFTGCPGAELKRDSEPGGSGRAPWNHNLKSAQDISSFRFSFVAVSSLLLMPL